MMDVAITIVNVDYSTQASLKVVLVSVSRAILSRHADDWYGAFPSSRVGDFVKSMLTENIVSKKFTLEVIVQVAGSLGTKSLDTNQTFSLRDSSVFAFTNTDLKPLNNNFKRIKHQFSGVITYKAF